MPDAATPGALSGLKVLDLSRVLGGPLCGQILGDHGADVLKIEPPQGDETRTWGPPFHEGTAAYFRSINRNKRGMALDLRQPAHRDMLLALLADADVLIENFRVGTMEAWGLGYEDVLAERFPRLVYCRVSGFGADGPYGGLPGYDAAVQALSGLMSVNGDHGGPPLRVGVPVVDIVTGLHAALGIMMAIHERGASGRGQFVEAALFDSAILLLHPHLGNFLHSGRLPVRSGNAHPNIAPYDCFDSATTQIFLAVGNDGQFGRLCRALGRAELATDPRFADNASRNANRDALRAELEEVIGVADGVALADRLMADGVPCAPVLDLAAIVAHPQTAAREMLIETDGYRGMGVPIKLGRTPGGFRRPPPDFDADGPAIRAALGDSGKQAS